MGGKRIWGQVFAVVAIASGLAALAFSLSSALALGSSRWLLLVLLQLGSSSLRGWSFDQASGRGNGIHQLGHLERTWSQFFTLSALLAYSPAVAALTAAAELNPILTRHSPHRRLWNWNDWFHLSLPALVVLPLGRLFAWWIGRTPPFDAADLATRPVTVLGALGICASLIALSRSVLPGVWAVLRGAEYRLKSELWTIAPSVLGAALAGSGFLVFGANYLLVAVLAAPVVLIVYSRNRASSQRISSLIESRDFLQSSLDGLSAYIAVIDRSGRIVTANQAWRTSGKRSRLFGRHLGVGSDYLSMCRGSLGEKVAAAAELVKGIERVASGESDSFSLSYNCQPAAPDTWYIVRVSRLRTEELPRVIVSHQDITDQKLSESRLRESEARYRRFFEDDLTGDFVADGNGVLADCNSAFAHILGFDSPEQAVGSSFFSFFPEANEAEKVREELCRWGWLEYREAALRSADGRSLNVVANLSAQFDSQERLIEIKGYLFDDTRRKKLEAELQHTQKMEAVGQLAGGIAHDFNNILMVVTGYSAFLRDELKDHRILAEEADTLLHAAQQASRLTSKLLAFSRRQLVRPTVVDLNKTVDEMARMLRPMIGEDIELSTRTASRACPIRIDPSQLEQLILDLAVNSRDAMPTGGLLQLESSLLDGDAQNGEKKPRVGSVRLRIRDSGVGMTPEVLSRAFEPFFTTKQTSGGTGLGLSTAYGIAQQCGGRIEVSSQPGAGTCVEVFFPAVEPAPCREVKQPVLAGPCRETILVAEDQEEIRRLIRDALAAAGYHVVEARDGIEAASLAEGASRRIDLLLTDLMMPRLGGWELAQRLRSEERHSGMRVLFISGYPGDQGAMEEAVAAGIESCLPKPFAPETLLARVREILDAECGLGVNSQFGAGN